MRRGVLARGSAARARRGASVTHTGASVRRPHPLPRVRSRRMWRGAPMRVRGSASADAATAYGVRGLVAQEAQIQYDIFNDQPVVSVIGRGFMLNMGTFMGGI